MRGAAAIAVAAAPVFSILRRIGSIIGVLLDYCCGRCVRFEAPEYVRMTDCSRAKGPVKGRINCVNIRSLPRPTLVLYVGACERRTAPFGH